jgi:hypothetical protein
MVSKKHSELTKKQARDHYGRFTSPLCRTAPPPSHKQEVGRSSRCHTANPPSRQDEASFDDSIVEMWEVPLPPSTCLEEASFNDSPSASSGYNDECPRVKEVSSHELLLDFNCLV